MIAARAWRRLKGLRLAILAGVMTGAEALVSMGIPLPFSDVIPGWARALVIGGVAAAAFVLRILAQRQEQKR